MKAKQLRVQTQVRTGFSDEECNEKCLAQMMPGSDSPSKFASCVQDCKSGREPTNIFDPTRLFGSNE